MSKLKEIWEQIKSLFESELGEVQRRIKTVDSWDGAASQFDTTEAYCRACLIDVNGAAGRDTKAQSHCMLPVRGPGDGMDVFVDKAVMAAAGGRGITQVKKPDDVEQGAWNSAVKAAANKIISAYGDMDRMAPASVYEAAGKEPPEERAIGMSRLYEQLMGKLEEMGEEDSYPWPIDLYHDQGRMYLITADKGKLYRYDVMMQNDEPMLGVPVEVMENHPPMGQTRTTITRRADGRYRWFSVSATSVLNRVGEIDSRELYDNFIKHAEETREYPIRQFYHQGEKFRTGQADFLARDGNCYVTSGLFDDSPLALAEIEARNREPSYWGESIGYLPLVEPEIMRIAEIGIPVYTDGIHKEISTLPEREAANLFTTTQQEVSRMMTGPAWEAFLKLWNGDEQKAREWLEQNAEATNRAIETGGLITRQAEEQPAGEAEGEQVLTIDDTAVAALTDSVTRSEAFTSLAEQLKQATEALVIAGEKIEALYRQVEALSGRVAGLEQTDDKKQKQWLQDQSRRAKNQTTVTYRPREANNMDKNGAKVPFSERAAAIRPKNSY